MKIETQVSGIGTTRGSARSTGTWIVVMIVAAVLVAGTWMILRDRPESATDVVSPAQNPGASVVPAATADVSTREKRSTGQGSSSAPGGYVLSGRQGDFVRQRWGGPNV